jgi:hypothetical protein
MRLEHFSELVGVFADHERNQKKIACQCGSSQVIIADDGRKTMPMA